MFRQGGWAVPLSCEHPGLLAWLEIINKLQQKLCAFFGSDVCSTKPILVIQDCNNKWSPLAIFGAVFSVTLLSILLTVTACLRVSRWYRARHGSLMVAAASAGAAAVRKADPVHYPAAPHAYFRLAEHELSAPLLCAVCFERVESNNLFQRGSCCEVCGILAHESCARHVPDDCRPIALPAEKVLHTWKAAGTVLIEEQEQHAAKPAVQNCLYCKQPCGTDMFSVEPMWCCSWCPAVCHMHCYNELHPSETLTTRHHSTDHKQEPASSTNAHSAAATKQPAGKRHRSKSVDSRSPLGRVVQDGQREGFGSQDDLARHKKHKRQRSVENGTIISANGQQSSPPSSTAGGISPTTSLGSTKKLIAGRLRAEARTGSFQSLMSALTSAISGGPDAVASAAAADLPHHKLDLAVDVESLDTCHLGHHKRLVLPPTCTRAVPSASWTSRAKQLFTLPTKKKGKSGKAKAAREAATTSQESDASASGVEDPPVPEGKPEEAKAEEQQVSRQAANTSQRRSTWWGPSELQWQNYRIENMPSRTKPLLVFVNTKSGPMLGHTLRRKFLRLLNPLQVVELPREGPEAALKLFGGLPNLRLLVIGGDGTAAWIMSCIDSIQASMEDEEWVPPAIALLPLGTGNDLARCLNWGGGLGGFHSRGLSAVLQDIERSTVALLDRWDIKIAPQLPPGKKSSKNQLRRTASKMQGRKEEPEKAEHKAMNNYLGIGVDAKAALDFHSLRTAYPNWFRSQVGNKLWYTGLGAREIVQHSVRQISKRLQVICDGEPLTLPNDIEGVLFLNINSYMGGVDLWASGVDNTGSGRTGKQSLCDGKLEVVGVYGSWHLGQLQVGLSKARRLCQCSSACITTLETLAMQMDGEPWLQSPAKLNIELKGQAMMLRRLESEPLARMAHTVAEVLDHCEHTGVITVSQKHAITTELAAKLHTD
ncbi:hypothetical protein ABBQ38_013732 [Trebouxia sp. C0009 RCD-2024]